ncbi:hypothetical protein N665_2916s0007 [Sinapis alba]|nr:hypothetical protein N665_2916s0007 [Sinapis alba]
MASMAAVLNKTPFLSHPLSKSPTSDLPIAAVSFPSKPRRRGVLVRAGLIAPDGGKLVELIVDEPRRREKKHEATELPRVELTEIDKQWMHVLSEGWASPLGGFMRESEFLQTLHFNSLRLDDGSVVNMSVPIVLAIDDEQKASIGESKRVALVDSNGNHVAILTE